MVLRRIYRLSSWSEVGNYFFNISFDNIKIWYIKRYNKDNNSKACYLDIYFRYIKATIRKKSYESELKNMKGGARDGIPPSIAGGIFKKVYRWIKNTGQDKI